MLYDEATVRRLFAGMRAELHAMADRHAAEYARLRRELDEARAQFDQLREMTIRRERAEAELARLREIRDAANSERDITTRLH